MNRLALAAALALIAIPSFAFRTDSPPARGARIGVMRMSGELYGGGSIAKRVQQELRDELRARGFNAFDVDATFDEVSRGRGADADYYVEIASSDADHRSYGGLDVAGGHVAAELSLVTSRVAAEVRVYDGRTLDVVQRFDISKEHTALLPTSIGIGGNHAFFAFVAVPFVQYAQYRSAAHEVARIAADRIAGQQ